MARTAIHPGEHLAEELLTLAIAVRQRGIEERAAKFNRTFDRSQRLVVVGPRPAADAP